MTDPLPLAIDARRQDLIRLTLDGDKVVAEERLLGERKARIRDNTVAEVKMLKLQQCGNIDKARMRDFARPQAKEAGSKVCSYLSSSVILI
jgi:hypothetical protein